MGSIRISCCLGLTIALAGCGSNTVATLPTSKPAPNAKPLVGGTQEPAEKIKRVTVATSDDVLASAVYQLRPENFSLSGTTDRPVSLLNSWRMKQAEKQESPGQPTPAKAPSDWILPEEEARLTQLKFDAMDAFHIRDSLLHHSVAGYLSDRGRTEVERVSIVVEFVCRNISLWKDDEIALPLVPYTLLTVGRGSVEDRAWVCAKILEQLRFDAVVLRTQPNFKGTSDAWLLGVVIDRQIALFDLRLGLPVTNDTSDGGVATLSEVVLHPEWLERMSANEPYRITADGLRDCQILVIAESNSWCRRMYNLEQVLPTSDICVLYLPLTNDEGRTGTLERVSSASGRAVETLKLWPYPRLQWNASRTPSDEASQEAQRLLMPLSVPVPFKRQKNGTITYSNPERKMQRFRNDQLLGKFNEATNRYLSIRHLEIEPNPTDLERLNRLASEDAFYWTALCRFELADYEGATEQLSGYLKKYDRKGKWFFPARTLLAQSYAKLGKWPKAISTLDRISSDDPDRPGNAVRKKRWAATNPN